MEPEIEPSMGAAARSIPLLLGLALGLPAVAGGSLTPELLVGLGRVREVALDPTGRRVAYTLEVQRGETDEPGKPFVELWLAAPGAAPRRFAGHQERISAPEWSPGGSQIGFLSDRGADDETDLYLIPADGGEARTPFEQAGSIAAWAWSPDGARIAFVAADPESEDERAAKKAGRDQVVHDARPKYKRLWIHDTATGATRRWFDDALDVTDPHWTPDGRAVVFQATEQPRTDDHYMYARIYRATLDGGPVVLAPTVGKLGAMGISPDGATLAFLGATSLNDPLAQSLFVVPLAGGTPRNLTPGYEGSAVDLAWLDSATLLLVAAEETRHVLYRVAPRDGARTPVAWPGLIVGDLATRAGSERIAFAAQSARHPEEVFVLDPGREPERLTRHAAALDDVRLARQETIRWRGTDGLELSGVLTYPLDARAGQRVPLVLQIHGGPEGISLDGWTTSPLYPVQLLAARGYAVLQPNYRGSQGRGVAFSKADHDDLGGKEFDDVLAGVDELARRGLVDPQRVGTGGWSYGGYLSAWAATRHSDRFRAALVAAGLTNWIAFAGTTDIPHEMSLVHWDSWWFDEPALHWERSPLAHLGSAKTPALIVHGEKDDRVHPEQSLELYTALRIKGVPAQLVTYPREPHGLDERAHRLDFVERTLAWFDEHLGTMPSTRVPEVPAGAGTPQ